MSALPKSPRHDCRQLDRNRLPAQDLPASIEDFAKSVKEFAKKFDGLPQGVTVKLDLAAQQWLRETGGGDSSAFTRRLQSALCTL